MRTSKAIEAKEKRETDATEWMRLWSKANARAKEEIASIAAEASKRAKVMSRERADVAKRKTEEGQGRGRDIKWIEGRGQVEVQGRGQYQLKSGKG